MEHKISETPEYLVRLLDIGNENDLNEVKKLRYRYLLCEFDEGKADADGTDDDGYDAYSDSIIVTEKKTGAIVGTYRLATKETLKGMPFKSEEEFDITELKNDPDGIVEAGRAVVHGDHRNGAVIGLLWKALVTYAAERELRYIIGTCSMHGTDPEPYSDCTSVLRRFYLCDRFDIRAKRDTFEYGTKNDVTPDNAEIPGLLKAYLRFGAKVSKNGFIDREFNSCDVMVVLDRLAMDERILKRFLR